MIIAKLKKLEASDGNLGTAASYSFADGKSSAGTDTGKASRKTPVQEDAARMLNVPRDGWLSGPGRHLSFG